METIKCALFGEEITSTIGSFERGDGCVSHKCCNLVIDWENRKVFINSPSGYCICNDYEGTQLGTFRGCAEIDSNGEVIINDFDSNNKSKPY